VIEIAEELVESMRRREELVAVAQMVLAKLSCHVTERLQHVGDRRVFRLQSDIGARQTNLREACPDRRLAGDERGAARRAALLPVPVGEVAALFGNAIDVRRAIA